MIDGLSNIVASCNLIEITGRRRREQCASESNQVILTHLGQGMGLPAGNNRWDQLFALGGPCLDRDRRERPEHCSIASGATRAGKIECKPFGWQARCGRRVDGGRWRFGWSNQAPSINKPRPPHGREHPCVRPSSGRNGAWEAERNAAPRRGNGVGRLCRCTYRTPAQLASRC